MILSPSPRPRRPLAFALLLALTGCAGSGGSSGTVIGSAPLAESSPAELRTVSSGSAAPSPVDVATGGAAPSGVVEGADFAGGVAEAAPAPSPSSVAPSRPARAGGGEARSEASRARGVTADGRAPTSPSAPSTAGAAPVAVDVDVRVTVHDDETVMPPPVQAVIPQARVLTAAAVGDTDRRGNYLQYVGRHPYEARRVGVDVTRRVRVRVQDRQGRPLRNARVTLAGQAGSLTATTMSDGFFDYFPGVLGDVGSEATLSVEYGRARAATSIILPRVGDGADIQIALDVTSAPTPPALDLAFLIDVTGSMEDELRYVNAEIADIVGRVHAAVPEVRVRVGATFYRDRTDAVAVQEIPFTADVPGFARAMHGVMASGGGDYPEDMNAGLAASLGRLDWSTGDATRILVVVADAPPQRYASQFTYIDAMRDASRRGIRLVPVAASGADREVEFLFRAMATVTGAPYTYLTDESGIGNPHMEADTDRVAIEFWNDLLTRYVVSDLRGQGMHELIQ